MSDSSPFDFFRQEATHAEVTVRADAMNKLLIIISLMSPDKVRSDMIPFLLTKIDDLDQVLLSMAHKIGDFVPYIGGPTQAKILVPLLEHLCNTEETQVRTAAGHSVNKILKCLGAEHKDIAREYLDMYKRLVVDDGGEVFYGRVSACLIASQLYNCLEDGGDKACVREAFTKLSVDELSIIRRATVATFIDFCQVGDYDLRVNELLQMLKNLAADECASVKIMAVEAMPAFCKMLFEMKAFDVLSQDVVPLVKAATEDVSWRVKMAVSKDFGVYASIIPQDNVAIIFRCGIQLMADDEPEVRQAIVPGIFPYCAFVGLEQFLQQTVPMLQLLYDDLVPEVRKAIAELTVETSIATGTESMANQIADIIVKLLADEEGFVRLKILSQLPRIAEEVGQLLTRLTITIKNLYGDSNWRVRAAICKGMPGIIQSMGPDYFQNHFMAEYLHALKDGVSEVRIAIGSTFPQMIEAAGGDWFFTQIFPSVKQLTKDEYLVRLSAIGGLRDILKASSSLSETHQEEVLVYILGFTKDSVPNVRCRAAQALSSLCSDTLTDNSKLQLIRPVLQELQADKDKDVKYYASIAFLQQNSE